jgi:ADP-heptose:LPS heptosyltransferase
MASERLLRKSFAKVKKHISELRSHDADILEKLKKIEKSILSQKQTEKNIRRILNEESSRFVLLEQLDSLIVKNPDVIYMLQHFHDIDDISITKKQYTHFTKRVEQLRRDAAELKSIRKELKRNLSLETSIRKLNREVRRIAAKNG